MDSVSLVHIITFLCDNYFMIKALCHFVIINKVQWGKLRTNPNRMPSNHKNQMASRKISSYPQPIKNDLAFKIMII